MQKNTYARIVEAHFFPLIFLVVFVEILDILFKYLVLSNFYQNENWQSSFFSINLYKNYGIAFDIPFPAIITIITSIIACLGLLFLIYKNSQNNKPLVLAMFCLLLGALGNLFDRIVNGFTTDFIILFSRSAINLSDILIITGVILIFWYNINKDRKIN